MQVHW